MVTCEATRSALQRQARAERQLWLLSMMVALLLSLLILSLMGVGSTIEWTLHALRKAEMRRDPAMTSPRDTEVLVVMDRAQAAAVKSAVAEPPSREQTALPQPAPSAAVVEEKPTPQEAGLLLKKRFARTSAEQEVAHAVSSPIVGERNADAVSDAAPVPGAPALLPSQAGVAPMRPDDLESVNSRYQDGRLDRIGATATTAMAETATSPMASKNVSVPPASTTATPATALAQTSPQTSDSISAPAPAKVPEPATEAVVPPRPAMTGDVPVPRSQSPAERPSDMKTAAPATAVSTPSTSVPQSLSDSAGTVVEKSLPKPREKSAASTRPMSDDPAFNGNQKKTRILGSVSRTGTASQQVAATPLGKYQAQLSRVIESEWHRNCVKYRDFIKPGILTLRFVIDDVGAVRSVMLVEMVEAGDVQKGFTMNTIRQAKIPPLPADVKKELNGEALELIYNFYF